MSEREQTLCNECAMAMWIESRSCSACYCRATGTFTYNDGLPQFGNTTGYKDIDRCDGYSQSKDEIERAVMKRLSEQTAH